MNIANRVKVIAANKPTAGGAFTVGTASATNMQSFADAFSSGTANIPCFAESSTDWMEFYGTYTTGNLTVDTLISSSTGSTIDWSGGSDVTIHVGMGATALGEQAQLLEPIRKSYILGFQLQYSSASAIIVKAGTISVDSVLHTLTQTTLTSGSTMLDLAGSTVTLSANKSYYVYVLVSGGTPSLRVQEYTGSGNGAVPTLNSDDYYSVIAGSRRIGKFWTNGSSQIIVFSMYTYGRTRSYALATSGGGITLVNYGTATTYTSVTTTPYATSDDEALLAEMHVRKDSSTGTAQILVSVNGGTDEILNYMLSSILPAGGFMAGRLEKIPNTGSLHYKVAGSNSGYIRLLGVEFYV